MVRYHDSDLERQRNLTGQWVDAVVRICDDRLQAQRKRVSLRSASPAHRKTLYRRMAAIATFTYGEGRDENDTSSHSKIQNFVRVPTVNNVSFATCDASRQRDDAMIDDNCDVMYATSGSHENFTFASNRDVSLLQDMYDAVTCNSFEPRETPTLDLISEVRVNITPPPVTYSEIAQKAYLPVEYAPSDGTESLVGEISPSSDFNDWEQESLQKCETLPELSFSDHIQDFNVDTNSCVIKSKDVGNEECCNTDSPTDSFHTIELANNALTFQRLAEASTFRDDTVCDLAERISENSCSKQEICRLIHMCDATYSLIAHNIETAIANSLSLDPEGKLVAPMIRQQLELIKRRAI